MTPHTAGPWDRGPMNGEFIEIMVPSNTPFVGSIVARVFALSPRSEANARLIAAAPELLAALHRVSVFLRNGIALGYIRMPDPELNDPAGAVPDIVHAVIAKAEGR